MSKIFSRTPCAEELPVLLNIWKKVFGSIGACAFFRHLFDTELCVVTTTGSSISAMGYLIPAGDIICDKEAVPCAMIYAVATLPEYRGMGFGAAVTGRLISLAHERGYPAVVLCPSSDELFEYYSGRTEMRDFFYVNERTFYEAPVGNNIVLPLEINANEYSALREELLDGIVHIKSDLRILEYQALLCNELGGGLYRIGECCAVVECQPDGSVCIKELLAPRGSVDGSVSDFVINDAVFSISRIFPAHEYTLRTPSPIEHSRRFGMLLLQDRLHTELNNFSIAPWYGLAFD